MPDLRVILKDMDTIRQKLRVELYIVLCYLILLFIFNNLAVKFSWFWTYKWLDIPFHFVGGGFISWLGFIIIAIYRKNTYIPWILALVIPFGLGFIWEVIEFYGKSAVLIPEYRLDVAKDLLMNMVGGLSVYILWDKVVQGKLGF